MGMYLQFYVTNKVFLSPQGTIEKKKKLQEEAAFEDEFSLPSQDDLGLQKSNDDKKPAAVVKLDQYLKNHKQARVSVV